MMTKSQIKVFETLIDDYEKLLDSGDAGTPKDWRAQAYSANYRVAVRMLAKANQQQSRRKSRARPTV